MSDAGSNSPSNGSLLRRIGYFLRQLAGRPRNSTRADLEDALSETMGDTAFSAQERSMLSNILSLRERRVEDVMVPRADILAVEHHVTTGDLLNTFREAGHSRLPVYHETLDDLVGMVHIRDFLGHLTANAQEDDFISLQKTSENTSPGKINLKEKLSETNIVRPVLFAPPSMPAVDLLVKMQATRIHMAMVIDEYGGTYGLVTIEDIIEEVVGDIEDEHDEDEQSIMTVEGGWIAAARASIEEVKEIIGENFKIEEMSEELIERGEDIDTLGGLMTALVGRVPVRGELIKGGDDF
ncbi:MAG: hemolysin family protein, partial [Pseudomonadota bacterium]